MQRILRRTNEVNGSLYEELERKGLAMLRLQMIIVLRRQIEKRLWDALRDLLGFYDRGGHDGHGWSTAEVLRIAQIREIAK
jgi:hypothetical protein